MAWKIRWDARAEKEFKKLDFPIQKKILKFLIKRLSNLKNPRLSGKPLSNDKSGLWRYRVEDYRIICQIDDGSITILVVRIGHRKNVYGFLP